MKHIAQTIGLGLALLATTSVSPRAADWSVGSGGAVRDFGSIKDYRNAAVPVPAPTAAPPFAKDWYVRGDVGYNLSTDVTIGTSGSIPSRDGNDLNGFVFGSIGAGRYLTPSLRAEFSFDLRPKKTVTSGTQVFNTKFAVVGKAYGSYYDSTGTYNPGLSTTDTHTYTVTRTDTSSAADQTAFFNVLYDFHQESGSRFTPYIGAGVGIDSRRFKRVTTEQAKCTYAVNTVDATGQPRNDPAFDSYYGFNPATSPGPGTCPNTDSARILNYKEDKYTSTLGFAGVLMAGIGYEIMPGVVWDTGYRAVWEGAELKLNAASIDGGTSVSLSNRIDHELRTGVRIDLF